MVSPSIYDAPLPPLPIEKDDANDKASAALSSSSNSSSSLSASFDNANTSGTTIQPNPTRSLSATTPTMRPPPSGGGSQNKRHSVRSMSGSSPSSGSGSVYARQASTTSLDRSISQPAQKPTSPITSPSIHKSLTALDAKSITRDMEKSIFYTKGGDDVISPTSPTHSSAQQQQQHQQQQQQQQQNFYFGSNTASSISFQSMAAATGPSNFQYHRQNSLSNATLPPALNHHINTAQGDAWQTLCVRVLPLFNGEGVQGTIEDLNDLLRRCLSESITAKFYHDIEALLRDGMFTLNAKMFGVTDEKLLDRLVEQWSFFFTYALPYFEAVFLPLRTDVRYRSPDEAEMWNVRNMALRSFRDNVILLQTKRLEDVFNKLFTDFGSSQNPAATAAKMLQMTSLLASSPDHNEEIERVLSNLKANWKIMMTKGDRRGFAGVRKVKPLRSDMTNHIKHRRKCVRPDLNFKCSRCERLGKICQQPAKQEEQPDEQYGCGQVEDDQDIDSLKNQVEQLEAAVCFMERQLQVHRSSNTANLSRRNKNEFSIANGNSKPLSELSKTMIQSLFHNWKFKIENGSFQIETGIRNITELLQFDPSITYLSPLGSHRERSMAWSSSSSSSSSSNSSDNEGGDSFYRGSDAGIIMTFGKEGTGSLIPFTIKVLTRCINTNPSSSPSSLLLPSILLLDPHSLVDQLLNIYFRCHNIYDPLVHESSYRKKLATVKDPLTDLVTLGICSYVCSTPCKHLQFSPRERRNMGDFFHAKARNIIMDQFDEHDKRLENAIGINLQIQYMHVTLKYAECRQLVSMAYQILLDLRRDYPEYQASGFQECFEGSSHAGQYTYTKQENPITDVDKMLFARHITLSMSTSKLMDFIANDFSDNLCFHFPTWKYMEDEPDETKRFVRSQNWVINLYNHEFVRNFMGQIHRVHIGRTCTLSFESIIRIEDVIREWASAMPAEFQLCDNLYDWELCYKAIDQPKSLSNYGQELSSRVQEHSLTKALESCKLLLHAIHRLAVANPDSCNYLLSASEFLFHALDVLELLSLSPNKHVAKEARIMMKSCLDELDAIKFTQGHQVPREDLTSPLVANTINMLNGGKFDIDYYDRFPHPWFAMMYDASHFISSQ
ncbi:hypothetical protein [Parasitella parasitica]|uniref:Uncharacterized protein n=1 Tax=Parasitella parasitica TaxID=35722 RepID=A0A0B7N8U4_9FUNG|nr:hypothetical protein [Parasitella parasitica]